MHIKQWTVDSQERNTWGSGVRSAQDLLYAAIASYQEGGPLMWTIPLHLHVNQKHHGDGDDDDDV